MRFEHLILVPKNVWVNRPVGNIRLHFVKNRFFFFCTNDLLVDYSVYCQLAVIKKLKLSRIFTNNQRSQVQFHSTAHKQKVVSDIAGTT